MLHKQRTKLTRTDKKKLASMKMSGLGKLLLNLKATNCHSTGHRFSEEALVALSEPPLSTNVNDSIFQDSAIPCKHLQKC